jgi:hypothetical protein
VTSNERFLDRGEVFNDHVLATASLDHLPHHCTTFNIKGESYRLKEKQRAGLLRRLGLITAGKERVGLTHDEQPSRAGFSTVNLRTF